MKSPRAVRLAKLGAVITALMLTASCGLILSGGNSEQTARAKRLETLEITDDLVAAAQKEGTVTVRYGTPATTMAGMAKAFEKKYGIKVEADRKVGVVGTDQFRQEERADKHVVDVMWNVDPPGAIELADEGFLQRYTFPNIDEILPKEARLGDNVAYVTYWYDVIIQYNPSIIPPDVAKEKFRTWRGLLDPDLTGGKIGMNEPAGGAIPFGTYLMWYQDKKYGRQFLVDLAKQKPRLYSGSAPGREALAAGEIAVYIPGWEDIAMLEFESGNRTQWTYPEVAPSIPAAFAAISSAAPHPNAARLFAAWMVSADGADALVNLQARPTRLGVPDNRSVLRDLAKTDWWEPYPKDILRVPDQDYWNENYARLLADMRRVLGWRS
jgi:iron(III) transport system substrate-binding protein